MSSKKRIELKGLTIGQPPKVLSENQSPTIKPKQKNFDFYIDIRVTELEGVYAHHLSFKGQLLKNDHKEAIDSVKAFLATNYQMYLNPVQATGQNEEAKITLEMNQSVLNEIAKENDRKNQINQSMKGLVDRCLAIKIPAVKRKVRARK